MRRFDLKNPRHFFRVIFHRVLKRWYWNRLLSPRLRGLSDHDFASSLIGSVSSDQAIENLHESLRLRFFFHPRNRKDFFLNLLTHTQSFESILEEAQNVFDNKFQTLGSGLVSLGDRVDWHTDFKSGKSWPLKILSHGEIMDVNNPSDIKVPWELSRFHQVWWLGKAYWLSSDERYAQKFRSLVENWIEQNPPGLGPNWTVGMEAAIRAVNLIAGYYLFCESKSVDSDFWLRFFKTLYIHGLFIENNLEYSWRNGNHFLSDVVGLMFLGILFSEMSFGKRWLQFALKALPREMEEQVYADGVDYEKSTSYQRLVLELFYTTAILCHRNNIRLPQPFMDRLEKMFEYVQHYTRPDGTIPLFGDADDGRVFRFIMNENLNDHRHALTVGAVLFQQADFAQSAGGFRQDALWLFGGEGFELFQRLQGNRTVPTSKAFSDGGFYVMRNEKMHLMIDAGDIGMKGWGGHGHNDTLSFEYWVNGEPLIVDSGTFAYTSDVAARQEFRGVKAHNTIVMDDRELVTFAGLWLILADTTHPRVLEWFTTSETDVLEAEHHAYRRLSGRVRVRRRFEMNKKATSVTIRDQLLGGEKHSVKSFLHFAPGILLQLAKPNQAMAQGVAGKHMIESNLGSFTIIDTWYSRSYGVRERNKTLQLSLDTNLPAEISLRISPV